MLWAEYFEALTTKLPGFSPVILHRSDNMLLLGIVNLAESFGKAVDVEHSKVGEQGNNYNHVDQSRR